jgi:hypothetical protein
MRCLSAAPRTLGALPPNPRTDSFLRTGIFNCKLERGQGFGPYTLRSDGLLVLCWRSGFSVTPHSVQNEAKPVQTSFFDFAHKNRLRPRSEIYQR